MPRQFVPGYGQEVVYSGSGVNRPVEYPQVSRPAEYQSVGRTNINLQQIDEQLQMSRKLFPS